MPKLNLSQARSTPALYKSRGLSVFAVRVTGRVASMAIVAALMLILAACQSEDSTALVPTDTGGSNSGSSSVEPVVTPQSAPAGTPLDTPIGTPAIFGAYTPADITDVVLVTGQSNALGADTSYDAALDTPVDSAFAFTSDGWRVADLHQVWDLGWHPRNDPDTDPSNNFAFHFARKVAQRRPQRVVGFILVTAPGASIAHWDSGGEFFQKISDRVVAALNELPSKSSIDGILWHQGETDWADDEYYQVALSGVINNFRSQSWFGFNKPFICGETVEAPVNRVLMALNTNGEPWSGCVESDGLSTILDNLHFSAEGLRILGTRYATKYLQMTE